MTRYELVGVVVDMILGDIIQVKHEYVVGGQTCLNVFYYEVTDLTGGAVEPFAVLDELSTRWQNSLASVWGVNASSTRIIADNLTDGLEFSELATGWSGTVTGDLMPSFVAVNVRLQRDTKLTRNGSKRVSGLVESQVNGNNLVLSAAQITAIEDYCASVQVFTDFDGAGNNCTWTQRIVGRTLNASNVYVLDLSKVNAVTGVSVSTIPSSQVSRKRPV